MELKDSNQWFLYEEETLAEKFRGKIGLVKRLDSLSSAFLWSQNCQQGKVEFDDGVLEVKAQKLTQVFSQKKGIFLGQYQDSFKAKIILPNTSYRYLLASKSDLTKIAVYYSAPFAQKEQIEISPQDTLLLKQFDIHKLWLENTQAMSTPSKNKEISFWDRVGQHSSSALSDVHLFIELKSESRIFQFKFLLKNDEWQSLHGHPDFSVQISKCKTS